MPIITKHIEAKVEITPYTLAEIFTTMDSDEQAIFFNSIQVVVDRRYKVPFVFQLQAIRDSKALNFKGIDIMKLIGEYAEGD